jgi:prepilin peptidase CpaA
LEQEGHTLLASGWIDSMARWSWSGDLVFPLLLALGMGWGDIKTRRIPNYLTLGTALAGLGFQWGYQGWPGLTAGLLGLALGFGLLIIPYILGGMGAGDVKALAALGSWLGPSRTFALFVYMGIAGGLLALGFLWWKGILWAKMQRGWVIASNWVLSRSYGLPPVTPPASPPSQKDTIPYGVALALGMLVLFIRGE